MIKSLLISCCCLASAYAEHAPLEAWLKRQASITTLEASFTQERKLPALKSPTKTRGKLSFVKPDQVRWQLGEPFETLAVSDGQTLTLLDARSKKARRIAADSPQAARFSLLSGKAFHSVENFYQAFEVTTFTINSGIHQYTLKSKDRGIRAQVPWVFLDIDPAKNELRAIEMEMQDKSRIRTIFDSPRFNEKINSSLFQPDLTGYQVK